MNRLVSVAIPAFNHASYIESCLESVYAQTYDAIELVMIDDGSSDDTYEIARRYLEPRRDRFTRVVLERQANQGVSRASNACISACRGEWVHLLGSDDVLHENKVERIQREIDALGCPDLALVHADVDYIDEFGVVVSRSRQLDRPPSGLDHDACQWLFLGLHWIFNPTVTLRREAFLEIGGFSPELPLEDLDCWLRLSLRFPIARVPEVLASYRKHPQNTSRKRLRMLAAQFETYAKFLESNPGKIPEHDLKKHFRRNLTRYFKRTRTRDPLMAFKAILALLGAFFGAPTGASYRKFASDLNRLQYSVDNARNA